MNRAEPPGRQRGRAEPGHSAARTAAALLGAPFTAGVVGCALARLLPVSREWSVALGYHLIVPLWVTLVCILPLQRSGARAWLVCSIIGLPLCVALLVAGPQP